MSFSPDLLLEGPRGRHLCLAVASGLGEPVWSAWLHAAWHPGDAGRRTDLIAALRDVDPGPLASWRTPESFTGAVGDSVDRAMYWQPPDDQDVVAGVPEVVEVLHPIADAIAAAPGAGWWTSAIDLELQRFASLHESGEHADAPDLDPAGPKLAAWRSRTLDDDADARAHRPHDPAAAYGGHWWSTPALAALPRTTRALPATGSVALLWEEDGFGQGEATVWPAHPTPSTRVVEIDGPDSWVELVRRYPLDVSWGRRHDWYDVTGRVGTWLIPDWDAVSHDFDAVHLTVLGYLATATRALEVDAGAATMLAGFSPDETFWLTDTLRVDLTRPERWTRTGGAGTADVAWDLLPR